jgi:hypothetical protein
LPERSHDIIVSVDPARMPEVVERLRAAGMEVAEALENAGVVTGTVPESRTGDLERLEGVHAVEPARQINLPPPDSPVQ